MANIVTIELKNPPIGATMWQLLLTDWDITVPIREISGKDRLDIAEVATFEVPGGLVLPLRAAYLQLTKWNEDMTALIQLYYAQAMQPNEYDWDAGTYTGPPDPTYKEIFIPELGGYYYYVDTEELVLVEAAPPITQDWMAIIGPILVLGLLAGLVLPMTKGAFK